MLAAKSQIPRGIIKHNMILIFFENRFFLVQVNKMKSSLRLYLLFLQILTVCHGQRTEEFGSGRRLYEKIHSYTPWSVVTDVMAIDRDLHVIKQELDKETQGGWDHAESIYREGGNSKSVAQITLLEPLEEKMEAGTYVSGLAVDGSQVRGTVYETADQNETKISIQYEVGESQDSYSDCQVGSIPAPNIRGCFNSTGNMTLNFRNYPYEYKVYDDNLNYRTIEKFSSEAKEKMWTCSHCPFRHYSKYYEYYGEFNYADRIISRAFRGQEMYLKNGNWNFGFYTEYSLKEFIHKAMSYMSIWMYDIRQLEEAVGLCYDGKLDEAVHYWDEAVAYYTGSRSLIPENNGELIFHQAQLRCSEYGTCGKKSNSQEGLAYVNIESFRHFEDGQKNIVGKKCLALEQNKERIVSMMTIPLIQATLRYAHIISHETKFFEKHGAEGSVFALSVLPMVHHCNAADAEIIYNNMKSKDTANVDFVAVKEAFERNYECLNIKCSEVGGIWDFDKGEYKPDAYPCGIEKSINFMVIIGVTCGVLIFLSASGLCALRRSRMRRLAAAHVQNADAVFKDEVVDEEEFEELPPRTSPRFRSVNMVGDLGTAEDFNDIEFS